METLSDFSINFNKPENKKDSDHIENIHNKPNIKKVMLKKMIESELRINHITHRSKRYK